MCSSSDKTEISEHSRLICWKREKSLRQSMQRWKNPWVQWLQICKPRKDGIAIWQQPFWLVSKGIFPNFEEDCQWQHRCRPSAWLAINFMVEKTTSCFSFSSFFARKNLRINHTQFMCHQSRRFQKVAPLLTTEKLCCSALSKALNKAYDQGLWFYCKYFCNTTLPYYNANSPGLT